ncbi:hypothetical protein QE152_g1325 [Popillia japonica]|uniref:Uncharacterized protein n=1 Tax=Popillia japonica TaxID=7064 RepID=A0AAW1N6Q9_POPJA
MTAGRGNVRHLEIVFFCLLSPAHSIHLARRTIVRGVLDPINEVTDICKKKYKLRPANDPIFPENTDAELNDIERTDPTVINPHKP